MPNIKVSVIVPVYNMQDSLCKCLDSILHQTYQNTEIILVDDGSTDGSIALCDQYDRLYDNVICIHQPNQGIASAMNKGIDLSNGNYLMFVDSDDYIDADMIDRLVNEILNTDSEIVQCGFFIETPLGKHLRTVTTEDRMISGNRKILESYFLWKGIWGNLSCKLISREVMTSKRLPDGRAYADIPVLPYLLMQCNRYVTISNAYYHVIANPGSASRGELSSGQLNDLEYCMEEVSTFIDNVIPDFAFHKYYFNASTIANLFPRLRRSTLIEEKKNQMENLKKRFHTNYNLLKKSGNMNQYSRFRRLQLDLFYLSPKLCEMVERVYRLFKA